VSWLAQGLLGSGLQEDESHRAVWYVTILAMFTAVANLLFPPACLLCRRRLPAPARFASQSEAAGAQAGVSEVASLFCEACEQAMPTALPPVCQQCGVGLLGAYDAHVVCQRCRESPLAVEKARAPFVYAGMVREAIHAFKYDGRRRIGLWLASHMARTTASEFPLTKINAIVPVPLHWVKQRLKGTNPSAFLARAVAKLLKIPCDPGCLCRVRWTSTQTRLGIHQRFQNVRDAFRVPRHRSMGRTVLLVDDVLTSGATAHACALALRDAGITTVFVLTAARAPQPE